MRWLGNITVACEHNYSYLKSWLSKGWKIISSFPYINSGSDYWFRSGLGKSAFKSTIYKDLPLDYYLHGINATNEYYHVVKRWDDVFVSPKFYMVHDSFMMFYHDYQHVANSIKKKPKRQTAWWSVIKKTITSSDYLKLNKVIHGSQELSALAGAKFLASLFKKIDDIVKEAGISNQSASQFLHQSSDNDLQNILNKVHIDINDAIKYSLMDAKDVVESFSEAKEDVEEATSLIAGTGGGGYTHEALSVLSFLKNPDEFRKKVKILRLTAVMMRKLLPQVPTSLSHQQMVSLFGGISGVAKMFKESQIKDLLPQELAILHSNIPDNIARAIFTYRVLQKQAMVSERSATVKPVIFVDKSGSMSESFSHDVPKISVACGLALALYRKLNADVYLFDTEVERVKPKDIVKYLLTLEASGGTDITEVLSEIMRIGKKDVVYIIISDGIDHVDRSMIEFVKRKGLVNKIKFILIPPAWEESWLKEFKYTYARDVTDFIDSAMKTLR